MRTRTSANLLRRMLIQNPCVPDGRPSGRLSLTTQPFSSAGKSYSVAQIFEKYSSWNRYSPAFNASKAAVLSEKYS